VADQIGAWVVSETALVPVPTTLWLLGSGLIDILGMVPDILLLTKLQKRQTPIKCLLL
jgi:hypothetical protein